MSELLSFSLHNPLTLVLPSLTLRKGSSNPQGVVLTVVFTNNALMHREFLLPNIAGEKSDP